jgi:hypothetical protein
VIVPALVDPVNATGAPPTQKLADVGATETVTVDGVQQNGGEYVILGTIGAPVALKTALTVQG